MSIILTGGIATGKSTVANMFQKEGFYIVDADKIAHNLLDKKSEDIGKLFGAEFIKEGKVDRKKLGSLVFKDQKSKKTLESLLHPLIREEIERSAKQLEKEGKKYLIDIPLFYETKGYKADKVIVVYAPKSVQLERLIKREGFDKPEALRRIESQMDIEKKKELADIVIDNSKDIKNLEKEVKSAISKI